MGSAVVMNGRIYVIGGEGPPCTGTAVQEYNPLADTWRFVTDMPTVHHGIWPVRIGDPTDGVPDEVFVAGGSPSSSLQHVFSFDCEEAPPPLVPTLSAPALAALAAALLASAVRAQRRRGAARRE
jgi:hypothetical protein